MRYEVTLNVNLKTGSMGVIQKGTKYSGPLEELPQFVQRLVKDDNPRICKVVMSNGEEYLSEEEEDLPEEGASPAIKRAIRKKR